MKGRQKKNVEKRKRRALDGGGTNEKAQQVFFYPLLCLQMSRVVRKPQKKPREGTRGREWKRRDVEMEGGMKRTRKIGRNKKRMRW